MTLCKSHNAFILIYAKLRGPLQVLRSTTGPWPTVESHCFKKTDIEQLTSLGRRLGARFVKIARSELRWCVVNVRKI